MAMPVYESADGAMSMNGTPLQLKGVNWFGFQTTTGVFHGLWSQPASFFLDFLEENDFNAST